MSWAEDVTSILSLSADLRRINTEALVRNPGLKDTKLNRKPVNLNNRTCALS